MDWFEGFEARTHVVDGVRIHARTGGTRGKPPLLLLHGFPQTHVLWHRVARQLAADYFLVLPDLRNYGDSDKPAARPDHAQASKRAMAQDLVGLMDALGCPTFFLAGHDRGGRVGHRLALDHPQRVRKLAVLDIAPTLDMYEGRFRPGAREACAPHEPWFVFARGYYHWFHLVQPAPLPETQIGADRRAYLQAKLGGWGAGGLAHVEPQAVAEYARCFCTPEAVHAACEDYRASAGIDLDHDRAGRAAGQQLRCDLLVLWGERGLVHRLFDPPALWQAQCAGTVSGQALPCGHFIPEELPRETADAFWSFFRD
jgi:haloacetate dehalogenase